MSKLTHIIETVNAHLGFNCREKSQKAKYLQARWMYYKLALQYTNATLQSIGEKVGKDHSTVSNALDNRISNPNYFNRGLQITYTLIEDMFREKYPEYVAEIKPFEIEDANAYEEVAILQKENQRLRRVTAKQEKANRIAQTKASQLSYKLIALEKTVTPITEERDKYKKLYLELILKQ